MITKLFSLTSTRVIHQAQTGSPLTLCGRSAVGLRSMAGMDAWTRVAVEASSAGPCLRCMRKA